ncbi:MAG TPA: phosphotransferase family protein [Frankiaceae bacterium]|nr:phosphotransferase family protein [Frankiaceae bacterium]
MSAAATPAAGVSTGADPAAVGPYLARVLGDPAWASCTVALISGGKSNLTYLVTSPAGEVVLRRPPLAGGLPTAHDMVREHTVLAALWDTPVPVPRVRHLCRDESVLGVPFYVMDRARGHVIREELPPGYADTPAQRVAIADGLVDVLVEIHRVGVAGRLDGYGPPEGYLARQVRRWTRQWEASREDDLPLLDRLAADLTACLPEQRETTLVHGDYRLDNTVLDPATPGRVLAVLDWELSTLGDPLADVGLLCVYWAAGRAGSSPPLVPGVTGLPGFPGRGEVVARYARRSGRDVSALPWYVAFGSFKLAVVAAGIAARHRVGGTVGEGFDTAAAAVSPLVDSGLRVLSTGTVD